MKKSVKTLVLLTISFLLFSPADAQIKLPIVSNGVGSDIKKVIEDYPNRFINLMGEVKMLNEQSTDYFCNFKVNGAEETFVTRYSAKREGVVSWQALMMTTEDFEEAKKKFRSFYNQINNLSVSVGQKSSRLKAEYKSPLEEMKFTSILFSLDPVDETAKKLKVELLLQYQAPMEWKIKILVYDREREDAERGKLEE
ncbi:MAG: hypothetical protein JNK27_02265 [Chitinophagaceae bacterium]|nr:hypothetical protein [Chitinophagaceae bacterium]